MSEMRLDRQLQNCTVRITTANSRGTGFFVAPRLILTCAHVITNSGEIQVFWPQESRELKVEIKSSKPEPHLDFALLQLKDNELLNKDSVELDISEPNLGVELYCFGYPQTYLEGDSATFLYEGISKNKGVERYKLKQGEAESGLSGGPLLNPETGKVCGVISLSRGLGTDLGGRGIPIAVVQQYFPDLLALNQQFHSSKTYMTNPFIYSGAVPLENFWRRKTALDHIKNRIGAVQAQSVNIVGYRRQGKSSLLRYIKERPGEFFKREQKPAIVYLDLQDRRFHQPEGVTEGIRRSIKKVLGEELWRREENGDPFAVEDGLESLREKGYRLILLLDEFEQVGVKLEEFEDWGDDCRAKASAGLLALVVATKRPIHEVYQSLNLTSPFGTIFSMTVLRALERSAWEQGVLAGFGHRLEARKLDWIEEVAGGLPFYTQMAASILWQHQDLDSCQQAMTEAVRPHFEYLWQNLKDGERRVLQELAGQGTVKDSDRRILQELERYGLVKQSGHKVFSSLFEEFLQSLG